MHMLSQIWNRIQGTLFPFLAEELDPLTEKQKELIAILELIRIEDFVPSSRGWVGHPLADRAALARSFVAKMVYNLPFTRTLIDYLQGNPNLRRICGWQSVGEIPSESSFSRAFAEFAQAELPQRVHEALIEKYESDRLVGHLSRDSTAINAREKPVKKPKEESPDRPQRKRGRPKKGEEPPPKPLTRLERQRTMSLEEMLEDLPQGCDVGCKKNSRGKREYWIGYKLHVDWADGEIPVSAVLTSASLHDSQAALPLAEISRQRVTSLYDLMDAAYDAKEIKEKSRSLGHVPIIDANRRGGETVEMDPATARRYHERTTAERGFGRLKDDRGGRQVRVRGPTKVMAHLMFGLLVVAAEQLLRLAT